MNGRNPYRSIAALFVLAFSVFPLFASASTPKSDRILSLINAHRDSRGLSAVSYDPLLNAAAAARAQNLIAQQAFTHEGYDDFIRNAGYLDDNHDGVADSIQIGENLACGFRFSKMRGAFNSWLLSEGHLANLNDPRWKSVGIAVVRGNLHYGRCVRDNDYVIVALFGSR